MSTLHSLKAFISQRLTATMEEIVGRLETVLSEYEEDMKCRQLRLTAQRKTAGVQQHLVVIKEEVLSEQQEWISSLDKQDPKWAHVKEEKQDLWTSLQVRSQQQGLQENIIKFPFTHVNLSNQDEEESQSSTFWQRQTEDKQETEPTFSNSAHHVKTKPDVEGGQGPEADRILESGLICLSGFGDKTIHSSESQTDDSDDDWKEIRKPQIDLNTVKTNVPVYDVGHNIDYKLFSCSKCEKRFGQKHHLQTHMRCHTEKTLYLFYLWEKISQKGNLKQHLTIHSREKPCSCTVCGEIFSQKGNLTQHMTVHLREKLVVGD